MPRCRWPAAVEVDAFTAAALISTSSAKERLRSGRPGLESAVGRLAQRGRAQVARAPPYPSAEAVRPGEGDSSKRLGVGSSRGPRDGLKEQRCRHKRLACRNASRRLLSPALRSRSGHSSRRQTSRREAFFALLRPFGCGAIRPWLEIAVRPRAARPRAKEQRHERRSLLPTPRYTHARP